MKRIEQLQDLSREHHQSLILAQKAIRTSESQNIEAISELCQEIVHDYPDVWKVHFKIEEDTIFQLFSGANGTRKSSEISNLCHILEQEHQTMNGYYQQMKDGDNSILGDFGVLLKKHTRLEERQLFPLLENLMSQEELNRVSQVGKDYRKAN